MNLENILDISHFFQYLKSGCEYICNDLIRAKLLRGKSVCSKPKCKRQGMSLERADKSSNVCFILKCHLCKRSRSIAAGTFFNKSEVSLHKVLLILWLWSNEVPSSLAYQLIGNITYASVIQWYTFCRELCSWDLFVRPNCRVGGKGVIVYLQECKLMRKLYLLDCRRRKVTRIRPRWFFSLYDTKKKQGFMVHVKNRKSKTIQLMVSKNVIPGTEIWSDKSVVYSGISSIGYIHVKFRHSREVKTFNGVHKNAIKAYWSSVSLWYRRMRVGSLTNFTDYLDEKLWRDYHVDSWKSLLETIRARYPIETLKKI